MNHYYVVRRYYGCRFAIDESLLRSEKTCLDYTFDTNITLHNNMKVLSKVFTNQRSLSRSAFTINE